MPTLETSTDITIREKTQPTPKNKGGRPKTWTQELITELATDFEDFMSHESHWWFKDWAIDNWIPVELLSRWAQTNQRFQQAYARATAIQERRLLTMAIENKYAGRMVELVLKSKHGYTDRVENTDKAPENSIPSDPKAIQEQIAALQAALSAQAKIEVGLGEAGSAVCDG
jgi:hypothetical protein